MSLTPTNAITYVVHCKVCGRQAGWENDREVMYLKGEDAKRGASAQGYIEISNGISSWAICPDCQRRIVAVVRQKGE